MNPMYSLAALCLLWTPSVHVADGPVAVAQTEKGKKAPPGEEESLAKALEKLTKPGKSERDRFLEHLRKLAGGPLANPEAGDAEFHAWFDALSDGGKVWRAEDVRMKKLRELFDRVASRLGVTGGEIRRDEFLGYARQYLAPGRSPPWDQKAPGDEAGKLFRKLDRDGDGVLSADEMPPRLREDWRRWDEDGDGRIGAREFARYFEARLRSAARERGVELPGPADVPAPPRVYRSGKMPDGLPAWFRELDRDGDGQVGLYEWRAAGRSLDEFLRLDLNRDGFITAEEWLRLHRVSSGGVAVRR